MSVNLVVSEQVAEQIEYLNWDEARTIDDKLSRLLAAELRHRLAGYRLTDLQLRQKYGMDFETFDRQEVTRQRGYSWEVESDAMAWETAVDGMRTMERRLREMGGIGNMGFGIVTRSGRVSGMNGMSSMR